MTGLVAEKKLYVVLHRQNLNGAALQGAHHSSQPGQYLSSLGGFFSVSKTSLHTATSMSFSTRGPRCETVRFPTGEDA